MIRRWLKKLVRQVIKEDLGNLFELKQGNQYILFVRNDEIANDLAGAVRNHLDLQNGPRLIIATAEDAQLLEIVRKQG